MNDQNETQEVKEIAEVESNKPYIVQYEEELKAYRDGIYNLQLQYVRANEAYIKGELSKSQLKKTEARVYNEIREYKKVTPRPVDRRVKNISPTIAAMLALSSGLDF